MISVNQEQVWVVTAVGVGLTPEVLRLRTCALTQRTLKNKVL
uniref:Uncharacterized protein n=1 Tax=Rheinheimera sp. BAL341 TaxID=1708203 RepID=A0A486XTN8_9GAMM